MKLELSDREVPLMFLFVSALPVGTLALGVMLFSWLAPLPPQKIEVRSGPVNISPKIEASLPQGALVVHNHVPAAQIIETTREVVRVPDVRVVNQIGPSEGAKQDVPPGVKRNDSPPLPAFPKAATVSEDEFGKELPRPRPEVLVPPKK